MQLVSRALVTLTLAAAAYGSAYGKTPKSPEDEAARLSDRCDSGASNYGPDHCFLVAVQRTRVELKATFDQLLRIAAAEDKEWNTAARKNPAGGSSALVKHLQAAQAAWAEYSNSQCAFEGESSHGGSGTSRLDFACHYRLNLHRIAELRAATKLLLRGRR